MIEEIRLVKETASTNSYVMEHLDELNGNFAVVMAENQTAGKGLDGNSWESECGKNLIFSLLFRPEYIRPKDQFCISMMISLAIIQVLTRMFPKEKRQFSIKWPNDIYYKDCKLGGILIENKLRGDRMEACVIGIGLNVNQQVFLSDAPNPVSLVQIAKGEEQNIAEILDAIAEKFCNKVQFLESHSQQLGDSFFNTMASVITDRYNGELYWYDDEWHPFQDANGAFEAKIVEVKDNGQLVLQPKDGDLRHYWLKEVKFLNT